MAAHKKQWIETCSKHPELFVAAVRTADVGPLQSLIDELEFNRTVAALHVEPPILRGAQFADEQFRRAIAAGAISMLEASLKSAVLNAYAETGRANQLVIAKINQDARSRVTPGPSAQDETSSINRATSKIDEALNKLRTFLGPESE